MRKKVAITAPVYNISKKYLKKMVESCINQTYVNWELIMVDDGSQKDTADYLDKLALLDKRISVIHQKNAGCVEARRTGFRAMRNMDFIATIDSDDYLPLNALEIMVDAAEKYGADLVAGESQKVVGRIKMPFKPSRYFLEERVFSHNEIINDLLISYFGWNKIPVSIWGKLFDKRFLPILAEGEVVNPFTATDANASLNVMPLVNKLAVVNKSVYCYRTGGGTSKYRPDYLEEVLKYYKYRLPFIDEYLSGYSANGISAYDFIAEELKNETHFHLKRFISATNATDNQAIEMINTFFKTPEILDAFENHTIKEIHNRYNDAMKEKDCKKVLEIVKAELQTEKKNNRLKNVAKKIMEKL